MTATSSADATKSASALVTVTAVPAQISVSPTTVTFPSTVANNTSTQTVKVSNTGGSNLSLTGSTVGGSSTFSVIGSSFPITIAAGNSANLTAQFAPTTAGSYTGTITIASNASNTAPVVSLSGTGTAAPTYLLSASPTSVAFGSVLIGNTANQTVKLSNTGTSSISVSAANFTGSGFSLMGSTLPIAIAAGASQNVTITFAPQTSWERLWHGFIRQQRNELASHGVAIWNRDSAGCTLR